jgi:hypothetical protein
LFSPSFLCDPPCGLAIGGTDENLIIDSSDRDSVLQYLAITERYHEAPMPRAVIEMLAQILGVGANGMPVFIEAILAIRNFVSGPGLSKQLDF